MKKVGVFKDWVVNGGVAVGFVAAGLFAGPVMADSQCGGETAAVSGSVTTINLSETAQTGFVHLRIEKANGSVFFERSGVIVGEVVDTLGGLPSSLDHHMYFGHLIQLHTTGDQVLLDPPPTPVAFDENGIPCAFAISELITEAYGTRKLRALRNGNHEIYATGTVSFCPGNNQNNFALSGTACID